MAMRADLVDWLFQELKDVGGKSRIVPICKRIWQDHREELEQSGELYYTWQYDIRWAATKLRKQGKMMPAEDCPKGVWVLR
jgi:hypothetical protein